MKVLKYLWLISSYLPWGWLLLLYTFAIRAWMRLGHFPIPSRDDPKYLGFDVHYHLIAYTFPMVLFWVLPCLLGYILIDRLTKERIAIIHLLVFLIGCASIAIQVLLDPLRIIYWYLD